ncbi:ethanolamine phosphate transferase 2 subunit G [Entomortierella parvispora]|uniref:GPI ethanolamine phosphate transferase 2 n=1 Tax=Entomortierella parvispora TaxID=205924 RepID=A0A9P3H589_9FUNG|nr:ethanolamine phosphate transferase 2 subunit G [Entomortierella parvispora]
MRPGALYGALLAALACQLVGLVMFAKGFFPYKTISTTFATLEDLPPLPAAVPVAQADADIGTIPPRFGKIVLMLVDALRSDFLYGNESDFTFVQSLIESNKAIPFTALASAPTVTLPRIKALTTGTVPSFLDAILNIAESDQSSTLANQDNWILQMTRAQTLRRSAGLKASGKDTRKIGFFGDDTWIKLFPELFFRTDGTSSFFAMDTVEVDNNVTRHVVPELRKDEWDGLIFHYLGLDHVGHSGGPKSLLMRPKQAEMDEVAKTIYTELLDKERQDNKDELPTLFVLCGDHGMNEVGNHGGSSRSEISTSFLFMSPHFESSPEVQSEIQRMVDPYRESSSGYRDLNREEYEYYKSVNQVDLVPTLSLLLGLPIPKNSVGKLIPELFSSYSESDKLRALQINGHQVAGVLKAKWSDFETESMELLRDYQDSIEGDDTVLSKKCSSGPEKQRLACWYTLALAEHASYLEMTGHGSHNSTLVHYKQSDMTRKFHAAERAYSEFLSESSQMLSTALSKYDMALLTNGSMMMAFAVAGLIFCVMQTKLLEEFKQSCVEPRLKSKRQTLSLFSSNSSMSALVKGAFLSPETASAIKRRRNRNEVNWTPIRFLSIVIVILYMITLFASSFVEEEHQFWYFFNMSWFAVLAWVSARYVDMDGSSEAGTLSLQKWKASGLCLLQMAILRILRAWNQTGQKYADQIDLRHYLNSSHMDVSWVMFWASMVAIGVFTVSRIYSVTPSKESIGRASATRVFQGLATILTLLISLWITVYKMDLEEKFFGETLMQNSVHGPMSMLSSVGYLMQETEGSLNSAILIYSGYEMARGCYTALALLVGSALALQALSSCSPERHGLAAGNDAAMSEALFLPSMFLGCATFLLVLLSRRHQAPIFVLFGVQLWIYLEWTRLVRSRSPQEVPQEPIAATKLTKTDIIVEEEEKDNKDTEQQGRVDEGNKDRDADDTIWLQQGLRSVPGLTSIHSCTILIWILTSFFVLGNSNSIASIDISNAYVGIQAYDIGLTGLLTFLSNWAAPIWWTIAGTAVILRWDQALEDVFEEGAQKWHEVVQEEKQWKSVEGWKKLEGRKVLSKRTKRMILRRRQAVATATQAASQGLATIDAGTGLTSADGLGGETEAESQGDGLQYDSVTGDEDQRAPLGEDGGEEDPDSFYVYEEAPEPAADELAVSSQTELSSRRLRGSALRRSRLLEHLILTSVFSATSLYCLSIAAIVLRHHLFIWTVFSPKVLYQMAWTVMFQLGVQVLVVGGLSLLFA